MSTDLMVWAQEADALQHVADKWTRSAFVPATMQNKPEEILGAILAGRELGLDPMAALSGIDIIQGRPAMRAHTMMGLVLGAGHEVWVEEANDHRAVVKGKRKGTNIVQETVWTIQRAQQAGLAGKSTWKSHPQAMLVARGESEMCRRIAPDVLIGMPYTVEELAEEPAVADQIVRATVAEEEKPKTRRMKRAPLPPAEEEQPALPAHKPVQMGMSPLPAQASAPPQEQEADGEWPEVGQDMIQFNEHISDEQRAQMREAMALLGLPTGKQWEFIRRAVGRDITRPSQITAGDADVIISAINEAIEQGEPS